MTEIYKEFIKKKLKIKSDRPSLEQIDKALKIDSFDCFVQEGFDLFNLVNILADNYEEADKRLRHNSELDVD